MDRFSYVLYQGIRNNTFYTNYNMVQMVQFEGAIFTMHLFLDEGKQRKNIF